MTRSPEEQERYKSLTRRTLLLAGGQGALLSLLAGRMYYLQILESDRYSMLAEDNRINLRLLPPPRGRIVDRFGVPLATNRQNFRVVVVREQARDVRRTLDRLSRILRLDERDYERVMKEAARKPGFVPVHVTDNLTWSQVARLEANAPDLPGVSIDMGETRTYPYGAPFAHVLGYVAAVSERELTGDPLLELPGFRIGKSGVERQYDEQLRGGAGNSKIEVNASGRTIRELEREEGTTGQELVLTIDAGLQNFVHQRLMSEKSAAAVMMDAATGDVLALSSVPSFDPEAFNMGLSSRQWKELVSDKLHPLTNKATSGTFAPGSTFKLAVMLAALEAGIGQDHTVYCPGVMRLGTSRFHCWKRGGHGRLAMVDGLKHSCDVYFYDIARKIGIDRISDMAKRLGLGEVTGLDLPNEKSGVIPTRDWKLANIGEPWQGGETLVTAIGQGFVLATPLQLAVMTARIASGQVVTPRVVRGVRAPEGSVDTVVARPEFPALEVSGRHLELVRRAMDAVSNDRRGTAYRARIEEEGMELAGKTGTSQVRRITMAERAAGVTKNEQLPWRRRDHALFVCFAPVHAPRYVAAVVVEHGGGGSAVAAPIARDIMLEAERRNPAVREGVPLVAALPGGAPQEG